MIELIISITPWLAWILAAIASWLIFRYFKIKVDEKKLQPIALYILNLIIGQEAEIGAGNGTLKRITATNKLTESLSVIANEGQKKLFAKVWGTAENAVQKIFNRNKNLINNKTLQNLLKQGLRKIR